MLKQSGEIERLTSGALEVVVGAYAEFTDVDRRQ